MPDWDYIPSKAGQSSRQWGEQKFHFIRKFQKIKLSCSQHKRGESGQGLSNQKQAQSAEAEKQCATSSDKIHKPQTEPELIQSILHQGIIQQFQ